ncbi:MAG: DHHW family protein [bacterium]|nr:DHHW family protein [bacterium]
MQKKIIIGILIIWIFGMSLIGLLMPKRTFSEMENRYLAELPAISFSSIADGSFEEKFEVWLNDHFAMRDYFVRLSKIKTYALGVREFGDVYYAEDDTLLRKLSVNRERLDKNNAALIQYADAAEVPVDFALIPGAVDIWSAKLPSAAPHVDQKAMIQDVYQTVRQGTEALQKQQEECYVNCIDLYDTLAAHDEEYIFYHTDHHWTSLGAYYAYSAYAEAIGCPASAVTEYPDRLLSGNFKGTLYSDVPLPWIRPDEIHAYVPEGNIGVTVFDGSKYKEGRLYAEEHLQEKNQYTVFLGGNQPIVVIQNPEAGQEKLLIVRDSYMDSMAPFLTADFSELHLIDPRYYKQSLNQYIKEHDIDRVLICMSLSSYMESTGLPAVLR